jgi:hypothetical protein
MDWIQVITIIGVLGTFMFWMFNKLDKDLSDFKISMDGWIKHMTAMQGEQSKRTDKLYEMFIDLLKERK